MIDKPAGISVHPGSGMAENEKTLLHGVAYLFEERSLPFSSHDVLAHRLDKETTGCLLVAKNPEVHAQLQKQFSERTIQKIYLALVFGIPKHPQAVIDAPIGRSMKNTVKMGVIGVRKGRSSQTTYRVRGQGDACALLECDLHTGRTHQVRVHLSSIGHPVLGDRKYGNRASQEFSKKMGIENLCLHARKLGFTSPADNVWHEIEAPISELFHKALRLCRIAP
ncbi:hypothetical protein A3D11_04350 [Candidatus Peribacteria bacterium RIFCSPHIGHO2_02_FULL_49_16]|nr:MAG: hypothetical protein A3D11_04350 [Candidatus Peribacteria bacterium RIFCSPHIGHO2_02_FULL_49_16]